MKHWNIRKEGDHWEDEEGRPLCDGDVVLGRKENIEQGGPFYDDDGTAPHVEVWEGGRLQDICYHDSAGLPLVPLIIGEDIV